VFLVNGGVYPFLDVEAKRYRLRVLNACNARFLNLQLYYADASGLEPDLTKPGPPIIQFGTEGGFLARPVVLNDPPRPAAFDPTTGNPTAYSLLLAPAERADLIIDFSKVAAGSRLILYNDAPAPFPMGDSANDYDSPASSPDTRTVLQIRVAARTGAADRFSFVGTLLGLKRALSPLMLDRIPARRAQNTRDVTLNEDFDAYGRLIQRLGNNVIADPATGSFARDYASSPTEVVSAGSTEIWRIVNLTGDTHPIHFHLVNVQLLSRQPFDASNYAGTPTFTGKAVGPDPNERGWKETVRANPGEVTSVIAKFDLPKAPFAVPQSPRTTGAEYVWHCHILEHEEHDMMRPLIVK
jgi:spore coat protein A